MSTSYDRSTNYTYTPAQARPAQPEDRTMPRPAADDRSTAAPVRPTPSEDGSDVRSVIDRHSSFNGVFRSARDMRVEGQVEGEISCEGKLLIAQGARVKATVTAKEVEVAGELDGEVSCSGRFSVAPTGNAQGKVIATSLAIQEGAKFNGDFSMMSESTAARGVESSSSTASRRNSKAAAAEARLPETPKPEGDDKAGKN